MLTLDILESTSEELINCSQLDSHIIIVMKNARKRVKKKARQLSSRKMKRQKGGAVFTGTAALIAAGIALGKAAAVKTGVVVGKAIAGAAVSSAVGAIGKGISSAARKSKSKGRSPLTPMNYTRPGR